MDVYQRRRLVALSILAGVFVIIVLLVRSCGGDDEETPATPLAGSTGVGGPTSLSQEDYADQADDTCLETNTALAAVDQSDPASAAGDEGQIVAGQLETLQTLPPPTDGENKLDSFLGALEDQVRFYDRYVTALERGDDTAAAELEARIDEAAAEAQDAAEKFGFGVCGDTSQVGGGGGGGEDTSGATDTTTTAEPAPVEPVEPAPTTPTTTPPAPAPADGGGATPEPAPAPAPSDGDGSDSGGVTP